LEYPLCLELEEVLIFVGIEPMEELKQALSSSLATKERRDGVTAHGKEA
jgi:hypothetical protein